MKTLLAGLLLVTATACVVPRRAAVMLSWGPNPWFTYCTWDAPCWYSANRVFVYRWGYVNRPTYTYLYRNPGRRDAWRHRRLEWHPNNQPRYHGRDWDAYEQAQNHGRGRGRGRGR